MESDCSGRVGGEEREKVKIDHSFDIFDWEGEVLALKQISPHAWHRWTKVGEH